MKRTWTRPAGTVYCLYEEMLQQKHLLIAGATGSGKSVVINGMIYTALYRFPGDSDKSANFILIDPKRVELVQYKDLPHTILYASEPGAMSKNGMVYALRYAVALCDARFKDMQSKGQRKYPGSDVYVVIDELADLMTTARRQVQPLLQRLCQIGRAAKVHVVAATQAPIAKVIPTEIKVNFDSIVGLHTVTAQHSRNILGITGCETLPPYGDLFFQAPGEDIRHFTGVPMISDEDIAERVKWWTDQNGTIGFLKSLFGG